MPTAHGSYNNEENLLIFREKGEGGERERGKQWQKKNKIADRKSVTVPPNPNILWFREFLLPRHGRDLLQ